MTNILFLKKILVIQTAFIGDAVLTLPMIQQLKKIYPDHLIDVIAIPSTFEIFSSSPFVNEVIILDKKENHKSLFSLLKFIKEIKSRNYAKIFSPHRSFRTSFIVMQSGVKETYGFDISSMRHIYKYLVEYKPDHHEVQRNLNLIGYNSDNWKIKPVIKRSDETIKKIDSFLRNYNLQKNIMAIAPGSIWNTKRYLVDYFKEIIEYYIKDFSVILIGGDNDKELCENIRRHFNDKIISSAGYFNLVESVELLSRCRILISNDSAPAHLGVSADIPVLMIYCSTVPDFGFYPYNEGSSYLSFDDLSCKPCGIHGYNECPLGHFLCAKKLTSGSVISKINLMIHDNQK